MLFCLLSMGESEDNRLYREIITGSVSFDSLLDRKDWTEKIDIYCQSFVVSDGAASHGVVSDGVASHGVASHGNYGRLAFKESGSKELCSRGLKVGLKAE
jgi:hypothetical protein